MNPGTTNMNPDEKKQDNWTIANREKYWSELGIEEKLERMRMIVKGQNDEIRYLNERLSKVSKLFTQHQHSVDGKILLRIKSDFGGIYCQETPPPLNADKPKNLNEVYF